MFHDKRHPVEMGAAEVKAFLTHFALDGDVAAATQNQVFSTLSFYTAKYWNWFAFSKAGGAGKASGVLAGCVEGVFSSPHQENALSLLSVP